MTNYGRELVALRHVVEDERRLEPRERDWSRVQAKLEQMLAEPVPERPARRRARPFAVLAAAAALAAGATLAFQGREAASSHAHPTSPESAPVVRGDSLTTGSELAAAANSVAVEHANHAHWTLLPDSRAVVTRNGSVIELDLQSGSVDVEVVPQPVAETFVVLAANVRVAVHGTKFRVTRASEHVEVTVSEGVVAVSRRDQTTPVRLAAPASGAFELDGTPRTLDRASASNEHPTPARHGALPGADRAESHQPSAPLPLEPSIGEVEAGVSRVLERTQGCFERHTAAQSGVQVSARTTIHFQVLADGRIPSTTFDPPLAPNVQACADRAIRELRLAQSQRGIDVTRVLELSR